VDLKAFFWITFTYLCPWYYRDLLMFYTDVVNCSSFVHSRFYVSRIQWLNSKRCCQSAGQCHEKSMQTLEANIPEMAILGYFVKTL